MNKVVLAISGSPRKSSLTERMLDGCIAGMGSGLEIHKFYPHTMNIAPCTGCMSCWRRNCSGECVLRDDFRQILHVYKRADFVLIAAPLYAFGFPATVKNILDRFFVILEPALVAAPGGGTRHPARFTHRPKAALISSCGFPEVASFDLLRQHFRVIAEHLNWAWAGEILLPASGIAYARGEASGKFDLVRHAGEELMTGAISSQTTEAVAYPMVSDERYRRLMAVIHANPFMATLATAGARHRGEGSPDYPEVGKEMV